MPQEPKEWRVRLGDGAPAKLIGVFAAAGLAGATGYVLFRNILFVGIGVAIILASTTEFWLGAKYRLDEDGASVRNGPSVSTIEWGNVKRLIVNDTGVTLSPLAADSRLTPFRGVYLRAGTYQVAELLQWIETYGGEHVRGLV